MVHEPLTGVMVIDSDGEFRFANAFAAELFVGSGMTPEQLVGQRLAELFPATWVEERLAVIRMVCTDRQPCLLRSIWQGLQHYAWITPLDAVPGNGSPSVLVHLRRSSEALATNARVIEAQINELGPLAKLTPRELEVLALLGQSMSIKEIAQTLHRAPKTIENHRNALGEKLGLSDRVELAEVARRAGLKLEDARKPRY